MAEASTYKTTANAATGGLLDVDVSPVLWHVAEPSDCPLNALEGGDLYIDGQSNPQKVKGAIKKEITTEVDYKVIEKDPLTRTWTVNGAVASTSTATVALDSNAGLHAGCLLRNQSKSTPEVMLVTAVDAGGANLTVRRNLGSTAYMIADDSVLVCIGYATKQGGSKRAIRSQIASPRVRYCQTFKNSFGITGSLDASKLVTEIDAWSEEMKQAAREHQLDKEFAYWFNPGADSSTDTNSATVYLTRGIIAELMTDSECYTDCNGAMTEDDFFGRVLQNAFKYGPSRKTAFFDAQMLSMVDKWARNRIRTEVGENRFGQVVNTLFSIHGTLDIVHAGVFSKVLSSEEAGFGVVLDLDRIVKKFMKDRDGKYQEKIETPGDDVREAQFLSEVGISVRSLKHHHVIRNAYSS